VVKKIICNLAMVYQEDLRVVQVTHYTSAGDENEVTFSLWTLDANGHLLFEEENPYGMLPFVPCWGQPVTDFFWQRGRGT